MLALTLVFLPHLTRLAGRLWPDPARTERVSQVLKHELTESARLELVKVEDQGVLEATVKAALIGEVQRVTIEYDYSASVGVDLRRAEVKAAEDGTLILLLPPMEILSDDLTPTRVDRQDFWYPLTEKRRTQLLTEERQKRAEAALTDAGSGENREKALRFLRQTVEKWLGADTWLTTVKIRFPDAQEVSEA